MDATAARGRAHDARRSRADRQQYFSGIERNDQVVSGPAIRWTWQIAEVFRIEKGMIDAVESVVHPVPYGMGSGWSTWEESMSSLPRW